MITWIKYYTYSIPGLIGALSIIGCTIIVLISLQCYFFCKIVPKYNPKVGELTRLLKSKEGRLFTEQGLYTHEQGVSMVHVDIPKILDHGNPKIE